MDLERVQRTKDGGFKMVFPKEDKRVLIGETPDRLWIMRGCDELTA
jgi:isochorismate synthase EntC